MPFINLQPARLFRQWRRRRHARQALSFLFRPAAVQLRSLGSGKRRFLRSVQACPDSEALVDQLLVSRVRGGTDGRDDGAGVRGLRSPDRGGSEECGGGKQVTGVHGGSDAVTGPRMLGAHGEGAATDT